MKTRALLAGSAVLMGNLFAAAAAAQSTPAPSTAPPQAPSSTACAAPESRQLDFWIGEWQALDSKSNEVLGTSSITPLLGGCVIQEHWTSPGGSGTSLIFYDAGEKKWRYNWVSDKGNPLYLTGSFAGGKMVMTGQTPDRKNPGTTAWRRMTWEKIPPDRVHQVFETSPDGKTWTLAFDGIYVPRK